jgi:hypothetical protein
VVEWFARHDLDGAGDQVKAAASVCLGLALSAVACRSASPQPSAAPNHAPPSPPSFTFAPPQPWHSKKPDAPVVAPPDLKLETWRALVSQTEPLQQKTPHWQALDAERTLELEMPPQSAYRCLVTPLRVAAKANTWGTKLLAWAMERTLLCSSDDYRTWIESTLRVTLRADGTRDVGADAGAVLRSRMGEDGVRQMFVLMRSDQERREATVGPPQILSTTLPDDDDG